MKNTTTFAGIMTISFLATALFLAPAASADPTTVCPLDAPPCARITPSESTGDADCDPSNGSGSVNHQVDAWTGAYPAGNSTIQVLNQCGTYAGYTDVHVVIYTPVDRYPTKWVGIYWIETPSGCFAAVFTGGRSTPNASQDVGVLCTLAGGPPTLPVLS